MRKAKIVATIGPSSENSKILRNLIKNKLDVARLNFSHGDYEEHGARIKNIRKISNKTAIMLDTKGPEIRMGDSDKVVLKKGREVSLTERNIKGNEKIIPINHKGFLSELKKNDIIIIGDGIVELKVIQGGKNAKAKVINSGEISSKKSVTVIGKDFGMKAPTKKDLDDIGFGINAGVDMIALSFIKSADEIKKVRRFCEKEGRKLHIVSKIEHPEAVKNIDEIIEHTDSIMVARGDLGVALPPEDVPLIQKQIIKKCNERGRPVIVATQMLKSMTSSPRATRAEVSDVANAILDGADAVMLSEETANGDYPLQSLQEMNKIIGKVEGVFKKTPRALKTDQRKDATDLICRSVWQVSREIPHGVIVAHTNSGHTARHIAKYRPQSNIIAFTMDPHVMRSLNIVWGVRPYLCKKHTSIHQMMTRAARRLIEEGEVKKSDTLIMTAGVPIGRSKTTNMMEIRRVDRII